MREAGRQEELSNKFLSSPELNARAICNMVICSQSSLRFSARCCYCRSVVCTCSLISTLSFIFVSGFLPSETWILLTRQTQGPCECSAEPKSLRKHIIKLIRKDIKDMRNISDSVELCLCHY